MSPFVSAYGRSFVAKCDGIARANNKSTLSKSPFASRTCLDTAEKVAQRIRLKEKKKEE